MTVSRRTEKQQMERDYKAYLKEEKEEEERLQKEEEEYWEQKIAYENYKYELEKEEEAAERRFYGDPMEDYWPMWW